MPVNPYQEIFSYPIAEFQKHLADESNERILFSGKYGIGKTLFLDYVFKDISSPLANLYDVYTLLPISYTVATNEDIIKYIKYDILIEFLKKGREFKATHLTVLDTLPAFLLKYPEKIIASIVYMVPKIGKDIVDVYKKIESLRDELKEFQKKLNSNDGDLLAGYLSEIETKEGSIYDNDIITRLISKAIGEDSGRKKVLVLEDLDRLDPEHVFRILNVFAAHFSHSGIELKNNKFNFDKIILVCDFENIRNIFLNKYGKDVDFIGYIDKFYSTEIHFFDNKPAIKSIISNILKSIIFSKLDESQNRFFQQTYFGNSFVSDFIICLLERGFINLRSIMKIHDRFIEHHYTKVFLPPNREPVQAYHCYLLLQLRLINDIIGDYKTFHKIVDTFLDRREHLAGHETLFKGFIFIITYNEHRFIRDKKYLYHFITRDLYVEAFFDNNDMLRRVDVKDGVLTDNNPGGSVEYKAPLDEFWVAFRNAIETLFNLGFLR